MDRLTKRQLEDMIINTRNQINVIDNKSFYSLNFYIYIKKLFFSSHKLSSIIYLL